MDNIHIVRNDSKDTTQVTFPKDLSSNLNLFKESYDEAAILALPKYGDNSDYSAYKSFEQIVKDYNPITDVEKSFVCRVKDSYVFSSDSKKGGYDRCSQVSDKKCRDNLNQTRPNSSEVKGFDDNDAGILNAMVRYYKKYDGTTVVILVKNMGNHRFWMKKIANPNGECELLMKVKFHAGMHDMNKNLTIPQQMEIEADAHHSDAGDRQSQNEKQKLHSGYISGRPEFVFCINFLKKNKINYDGIMQQLNEPGSDKWPIISSVMGLNKGDGNGIFKEYGDSNVVSAITAMKKVNEHTGDSILPNTPLWCFALMFKTLTEPHGTKDPLWTKEDLTKFFVEFYKAHGKSVFRSSQLKLSDLAQSVGVKSYAYICAETFWKGGAIREYYRGQVKGNDNYTHFTQNHPALQNMFINKSDSLIRKQLVSLLSE